MAESLCLIGLNFVYYCMGGNVFVLFLLFYSHTWRAQRVRYSISMLTKGEQIECPHNKNVESNDDLNP